MEIRMPDGTKVEVEGDRVVAPAAGRYQISGDLPDLPPQVVIARVLPGESPREAVARVTKVINGGVPTGDVVLEFDTEDIADLHEAGD